MYHSAQPPTRDRLSRHLPLVSVLVMNPWVTAFALFFAGLIASVFSIHYGLSMLLMVMPFFSYYLERDLLHRVLIPPFSCIVVWEALGSGLGVAFVVYGHGIEFDQYLLRVQLVSLCYVPLGWIFYRLGFGKLPRMTFPDLKGQFDLDIVRPLVWAGWVFLIYQVFRVIALASMGSLDRGDQSIVARGGDYFGIWSYFNLFPRLDSFCFFLYPLLYYRSLFFGKILSLALLGVYFIIAMASGSRGIVFFPILYFGVGFYFFRNFRSMKLDYLGIAVAVLLLPLIIFIDAYRNTDAYRETKTLDLVGRVKAVDDGLEKMMTRGDDITDIKGRNFVTLGSALLGVMDSMIYEVTPSGIPHAGFEGFNAIPYTFVPTFIKRNKPILLDSNPVLWRYTGRVDRSGKAMSLPADAYRRFGWVGVPFATALFFWMYGVLCGRCYKIYLTKNALWGILLILYLFSFFQSRPFGTILECWWQFSYNLVKHMLALYFGYWALKNILNVRNNGGAVRYGGRE